MKPRENRIKINMWADVSDGTLVFDGTVSNVSLKGLMLRHIPRNFDFYSPKWVAVIAGPGKIFKLLMKPRWSKIQGKPRWSKIQGKYMTIGFQIISPPLKWIRFINELDNREIAV
jgi:hypothetical protein